MAQRILNVEYGEFLLTLTREDEPAQHVWLMECQWEPHLTTRTHVPNRVREVVGDTGRHAVRFTLYGPALRSCLGALRTMIYLNQE